MGCWKRQPELLSNQSLIPFYNPCYPLEGMLSISKESYLADVQWFLSLDKKCKNVPVTSECRHDGVQQHDRKEDQVCYQLWSFSKWVRTLDQKGSQSQVQRQLGGISIIVGTRQRVRVGEMLRAAVVIYHPHVDGWKTRFSTASCHWSPRHGQKETSATRMVCDILIIGSRAPRPQENWLLPPTEKLRR